MKVLVIYDSVFGNTEKVAQAIGAAVPQAEVVRVTDAGPEKLQGVNLLIVGSPTRAFRPTEGVQAFLKNLPAGALKGVKVAGFDTRVDVKDINSSVGRFFVSTFGYAGKAIASGLQKKGGERAAEPEGFFVKDREGPLKDGELERAAAWARKLA